MRFLSTQTLRLTTILKPRLIFPASTAISHRLASNMSGPPKKEMVYFPNMTAALPASSGEFRRVLWTGLYSQVVLMTIPVGGDIGEEVRTTWP